MNSVQRIKEERICCGCGICAAVCPAKAIGMQVEESGRCEPHITEACVSCGKCLVLCPQNHEGADEPQLTEGDDIDCRLVHSKDSIIRQNATSGGFVTTLVKSLLQKGEYDGAFLVDGEHFGRQLQTRRLGPGDDLLKTQKSRYVQIGHTEEISYILKHRDEKLILVGTPCYFRGFLKVVDSYGLNRENYLLVGLFCDKTMTTHVWEYFDEIFAGGQLQAMHFRSKKGNGWPGDVRCFLENGSELELSRSERMAVKEYFMPECCLDCMDKLNQYADFSVGDDYVNGKSGKDGGNSLIIRTERAKIIWNKVQELFEHRSCSFAQIAKSQHLNNRKKDLQVNREKRLVALRKGADRQYRTIYSEVLAQRKKKANPFYRVLAKCKRMFKQ